MASAYKCDRCGELFKYNRNAFSEWYSINLNTIRECGKELDLCPKCEGSLQQMLEII